MSENTAESDGESGGKKIILSHTLLSGLSSVRFFSLRPLLTQAQDKRSKETRGATLSTGEAKANTNTGTLNRQQTTV